MSKLIPLEEAANILGMTVEQITELRSNHEIFGYRDGQNWKFKMTELERVAGDLDIKLNVSGAAKKIADDLSDSFGFNLDDSVDDLILDDDSPSSAAEELKVAADSKSIELEDDGIELHDSGILDLEDSGALNLEDSGLLNLEDSAELGLKDSGKPSLKDSGELGLADSGQLNLEDLSLIHI